ncbi:MAG: aminotransferase class V-fold PLP-dependent enzyme, partial [Pseudomonadota bacterium]
LARIMGVRTHEVSFGPSTTQNTYVLAQAFREWLSPGEAIVVTNQDHEANSGPWRRLADAGIEVREWCIDPETGYLNPDDLPALLDGARLLCFPHCSNVVGEINDAAAICAMARRYGVFTCVDGVSYAPHGIPNVTKLGADIYLFSAYKTFGPHLGVMAINEALGMALPNQGHSFNGDTLYKRFTPAGPDHAQVAAAGGIADYLDAIYKHHFRAGRDGTARAESIHGLLRSAEVALMAPLIDYLGSRNDLRLLGPARAADRAPTFSLALKEPGQEAAARLAHHGIMCGGGDFYAGRALSAMGVDPDLGVLRLSFLHYTTPSEVDRLITALDREL